MTQDEPDERYSVMDGYLVVVDEEAAAEAGPRRRIEEP